MILKQRCTIAADFGVLRTSMVRIKLLHCCTTATTYVAFPRHLTLVFEAKKCYLMKRLYFFIFRHRVERCMPSFFAVLPIEPPHCRRQAMIFSASAFARGDMFVFNRVWIWLPEKSVSRGKLFSEV